MKLLPLEKEVPGIDKSVSKRLMRHFNSLLVEREAPYYLYLTPDIAKLAEDLSVSPEDVFSALKFFSAFYPEVVAMQSVYQNEADNLFYVLQEQDLESVDSDNRLHNPDDPRVVYHSVRDKIRPVFVFHCDSDETC